MAECVYKNKSFFLSLRKISRFLSSSSLLSLRSMPRWNLPPRKEGKTKGDIHQSFDNAPKRLTFLHICQSACFCVARKKKLLPLHWACGMGDNRHHNSLLLLLRHIYLTLRSSDFPKDRRRMKEGRKNYVSRRQSVSDQMLIFLTNKGEPPLPPSPK